MSEYLLALKNIFTLKFYFAFILETGFYSQSFYSRAFIHSHLPNFTGIMTLFSPSSEMLPVAIGISIKLNASIWLQKRIETHTIMSADIFILLVYRFGKFCGIVTVESFAASAMGLTVGAMVPTTEAALALGPSLMTVFIVFGGSYVNSENTPIIFRWIPRVSLIRWY